MYAYEIPGWLTGKPIRRKGWPIDQSIFFKAGKWSWTDNKLWFDDTNWLFSSNDWEEYKESEPQKITLYRYTYQLSEKCKIMRGGEKEKTASVIQSNWTTDNWYQTSSILTDTKLIMTESKTITIGEEVEK